MLAGWAAFPFSLSYGNTSWMPRWMRPGVDYLERGHDFDYPTDGAQIYLSVTLLLTGLAYIIGCPLLCADPPQPVCDGVAKWLTLPLPTYMFLRTFALRSLESPGEAIYSDAVTRPRGWKLAAVYLIPFALVFAYIAGLPSAAFRACSVAYSAVAAVFLAHDFRTVYRARRSDGYLTRRFSFGQMCPESYCLLYFLVGSVVLLPYLWTDDSRLPLAFGVLTVAFLLFEHMLRFHIVRDYDGFMRDYDYVKGLRRTLSLRDAEALCRLAARGKGIFRDDGREWTVMVTRHPDYRGYLYVCTSDYSEESFRLDLIGEREVLSRDFATLREAFGYRLRLMRLYEDARRKASDRAEGLFEDTLFREEEKERARQKACKGRV